MGLFSLCLALLAFRFSAHFFDFFELDVEFFLTCCDITNSLMERWSSRTDRTDRTGRADRTNQTGQSAIDDSANADACCC